MADTALLNAEAALSGERDEANLQPKSFADVVEQGPAVDETGNAESENAPHNQNELNGTQFGLKKGNMAQDESVSTEEITNGKAIHAGNENVQKMELGDKPDTTTPETNGSDDGKKSYDSAVRLLRRT